MKELEVGMYVRTDKGRIGKALTGEYEYKDSYSQQIEFKDGIEETWYMDFSEEIVKASYNIIDLIEEGDYVNGHKVTCITEENIYTEDEQLVYEKDGIKSIVTKEMFSSISYEVSE